MYIDVYMQGQLLLPKGVFSEESQKFSGSTDQSLVTGQTHKKVTGVNTIWD